MTNKSISLESLPLRLVTIVIAILIGWGGYVAVNWTFGNSISQHTDSKEIAKWTTQLAPSDPQPYYALAYLHEKDFSPEELKIALANYEKAVSLSPNDYRVWLTLGKIRGQNADPIGQEKAFRKAVELAPNYPQLRWALGNNLLRQGKEDEAFQEISKAVEANPTLVNPAINLAWEIYDGDVAQISSKIGDSMTIKAGMTPFLVKHDRTDEALKFWNAISEEEKTGKFKQSGIDLLNAFLAAKNFRNALAIQSQITPAEKFNIGQVYNGNFELNVKQTGASVFDWNISDGAQPQISLDPALKRSGERSLILMFNSSTGQENRTVQQTVAVESAKKYKFEAFYRSDLKAISAFKWEIVDANDNKVLASTPETAMTANDWLPLNAEFTTASATQAVIVRLTKVPCKQNLCPISGRIWFDDLSLK